MSAAIEAATGAPFTPATQVIYLQRPETPTPTAVFVLVGENSDRGGSTLRVDLSVQHEFAGPRHTKMAFGFSVTNLAFGPVAPLVLEGGKGPPISYKRLYDLPAIPTILLRCEF